MVGPFIREDQLPLSRGRCVGTELCDVQALSRPGKQLSSDNGRNGKKRDKIRSCPSAVRLVSKDNGISPAEITFISLTALSARESNLFWM